MWVSHRHQATADVCRNCLQDDCIHHVHLCFLLMTSVIGTKVRRATSFVTNMEQIKHNKIRIIDIDLLLLHLFKIATASLSNIFSCSKALMATIRLNKLINTSKLIYSIFGECIKQLTIASISEMVSTKSFLKIRIS